MSLFNRIADRIIARAMKTPYFHITSADGDVYMERYWLVPYVREGTHSENGVGPVQFRKRPFAWVLQKFGIAARVHHILRSDDDRAFHDHPWDFTTIILKGGYWEITPVCNNDGIKIGVHRKWYGPGSILRRKAEDWHILEVPEDRTTWTLFITGKYKQGWGFLVRGAKVPYKTYLGLTEKE